MPLWLSVLKSKVTSNREHSSLRRMATALKIPLGKLTNWIAAGIYPGDKIIKKLADKHGMSSDDTDALKQMIIESNTLPHTLVSRLTGIPTSSLSDWMIHGRQPHLSNLHKLATWLHIPIEAALIDADTVHDPEVKIVAALTNLTTDQKQQLAEQIENMLSGKQP